MEQFQFGNAVVFRAAQVVSVYPVVHAKENFQKQIESFFFCYDGIFITYGLKFDDFDFVFGKRGYLFFMDSVAVVHAID